MQHLFDDLAAVGFSYDDVKNLEYLNDESVLIRLPVDNKYLRHNQREDVALYMNTMASLLEEELA